MNREDEVRSQLHSLIDPDARRDLGALGAVKDLRVDDAGRVALTIELANPAGPGRAALEAEAEARLRRLPWVTDVTLFVAPRPRAAAAPSPRWPRSHTSSPSPVARAAWASPPWRSTWPSR